MVQRFHERYSLTLRTRAKQSNQLHALSAGYARTDEPSKLRSSLIDNSLFLTGKVYPAKVIKISVIHTRLNKPSLLPTLHLPAEDEGVSKGGFGFYSIWKKVKCCFCTISKFTAIRMAISGTALIFNLAKVGSRQKNSTAQRLNISTELSKNSRKPLKLFLLLPINRRYWQCAVAIYATYLDCLYSLWVRIKSSDFYYTIYIIPHIPAVRATCCRCIRH